jgi:hypothetical protein
MHDTQPRARTLLHSAKPTIIREESYRMNDTPVGVTTAADPVRRVWMGRVIAGVPGSLVGEQPALP